MTTTSSISSTATPTPTPTPTSTSSSSGSTQSIVQTLGVGSGIDITSLVDKLVTAQYDNTNQALSAKADTLTTQISTVASLKSAISTFDSSLKSLIQGGTLRTQPTSSNTGVVNVSALQGGSVGALSSTLEVRQLAAAQVTSTAPVADPTAAIGTGTLTLSFGTATVSNGAMTAFTAGSTPSVNIAITSANNSLQGIAAAINAQNAGVTASILSDAGGSRLVLKSATGAAQAFTLSATEDSSAPGLSKLAVGVGASGTTINSTAQDALVAVDGIAVRRPTNSIKDLVPGVQVDLVSAAPGTIVNLGSTPPTDALSQAVSDFVSAYNLVLGQLTDATDPVSGPLKSDVAAQNMLRQLGALTLTDMVPGASSSVPHTLAAIGVATNRDGTLTLNSAQLTKALATNSATIEAMFQDGVGISAALDNIATAAANTTYGLGASQTTYENAKSKVADDQAQAATDADNTRTRLTQQFSSMDAIVASYKSTQSFLQQQIDAWNNKNQ